MANQVQGIQMSQHLAQTTGITFSSKATVKIGDSYYSFEFQMSRQIPLGADEVSEISALTDDVNAVIDDQIDQIVAATGGK